MGQSTISTGPFSIANCLFTWVVHGSKTWAARIRFLILRKTALFLRRFQVGAAVVLTWIMQRAGMMLNSASGQRRLDPSRNTSVESHDCRDYTTWFHRNYIMMNYGPNHNRTTWQPKSGMGWDIGVFFSWFHGENPCWTHFKKIIVVESSAPCHLTLKIQFIIRQHVRFLCRQHVT